MSRRTAVLLLPIIYLGFISLGLPDGTLGVAWPRMHLDLARPLDAAGLLMIVATLLSATASFTSGRVLGRFGTGPVVLASCVLTGGALLATSQVTTFAWLVAAAVPLGLGAGAVDTGLNSYVARHYTGRHMNWLHACWGIGATSGPLIMTHALTTAQSWRGGYLLIGSLQLGLAAVFLATLRLWNEVPEHAPATAHPSAGAGAELPQPLHAANSEAGWLSAAIFLVYVAAEMTVGLWANSILVLSRQVPQAAAGVCVSVFYASITGGRIANGFIVDHWGNRRLVTVGSLVALVGAALFVFVAAPVPAAIALGLMGLGFSPIYPGLMHEVPRRFAPGAVAGIIGRQSGAACIGAAIFPAAAGWLSARLSLEAIAWCAVAGALLLVAAIRRLDRIS
ncbi:MAG TPA: MFS transporter [Opitutaceae bacterium]|nr:MFS transporter [Opitutaceae bacterium]